MKNSHYKCFEVWPKLRKEILFKSFSCYNFLQMWDVRKGISRRINIASVFIRMLKLSVFDGGPDHFLYKQSYSPND